VKRAMVYTMAGGIAAVLAVGCQGPVAPPPQNVPPQGPPPPSAAVYPADIPKPLPQPEAEPPPPAFDDPPLVDQKLPEEAWFLGTYNQVGRPRIALFVNRTLDGDLIGDSGEPIITTTTVQGSNGAVDVQHSDGSGYSGYYSSSNTNNSDQFKSNGPAEYHQSTTVYLHQGQYDDASLAALDYSEMESLLSDWIGCDGQVTLIAPGFIRAHLTDQQVQDLQSGKGSSLDDLSKDTGADVLIQVQAHPVRRSDQVVVLLVAEAINIRGGELLGHASVEMPTPVDRFALNNYTRFLARKLIHEMTNTWSVPAPGPGPAGSGPAGPGPGGPGGPATGGPATGAPATQP
jgi:hypothetical protein